jgi:hypothetical protein
MFFITQRFNVDLKTFVPKLRNQGFIINYRLTSILGSTYKITSKVLIYRLQIFFAIVDKATQIRFVKVMFILDNVFLVLKLWNGLMKMIMI